MDRATVRQATIAWQCKPAGSWRKAKRLICHRQWLQVWLLVHLSRHTNSKVDQTIPAVSFLCGCNITVNICHTEKMCVCDVELLGVDMQSGHHGGGLCSAERFGGANFLPWINQTGIWVQLIALGRRPTSKQSFLWFGSEMGCMFSGRGMIHVPRAHWITVRVG